jgi:hypothetical protein
MILDNNAEAFGLLGKKSGIADVSVAGTGTARGVIVGKQQPPGIEVQGSPEDLSGRQRQEAFEAIRDYLFADHEAFKVGEDT